MMKSTEEIPKVPQEPRMRYCLDGICRSDKNVVGYCFYDLHKGCLTVKLLREHGCIQKHCHYLDRYEEREFWQKRLENKAAKKERKAAEKDREAHEQEILEMARSFVRELPYMQFVSVKAPPDEDVVITYVSTRKVNLDDIAMVLADELGCGVTLRLVKPDRELRARILSEKRRAMDQ